VTFALFLIAPTEDVATSISIVSELPEVIVPN
jgi:hypothetical protein